VKTRDFDLILDGIVQMPVMDGLKPRPAIRRAARWTRGEYLPIIAPDGQCDAGRPQKCLEAGNG